MIQISDYIVNSEAIKEEINTIEIYKNNGWTLLNKVKGGSLGGKIVKWTKEKCIEEALKYKSKSEFRKLSHSCYKISLRKGWIDEITKHMCIYKMPKGYWTKEKCIEEALRYKSKSEFIKGSYNCYKIASKNKWLDEITIHMSSRKKKTKWTKEMCIEEALRYKSKSEFIKGSYNCYKMSCKRKWINEIKILWEK